MISIKLQRIILLIILAYEAFGGILGGIFLLLAPDGHLMKIPTTVLHGVFTNFFIPGLILTGMGILTLVAFAAVLLRNRFDWLISSLAMYGFIIWFAVEIAIVREVVWLHYMWGLPVIVGGLIVLPKTPWNKKVLNV
jgi:hypothetical protein